MSPAQSGLSLKSPVWAELRTAYGSAEEIPKYLELLREFPVSRQYTDEPWFSLWSALCHQGDVFSASFAAVPHVIKALRIDPRRADFNYFLLPVSIELARLDKRISVPKELEFFYHAALRELRGLAAEAATSGWGDDKCASALAAVALSTGKLDLARLLVEVEPKMYRSIIDRVFED